MIPCHLLARDISKDIPEVLDNLCQRMLKENPIERMQTLNVFIEELTQYLKHQGKTIAGFGTFSQLSKSKAGPDSAETLDGNWKRGIRDRHEESIENDRLRKKVDILVEIAQLNPFSGKRRKRLWGELGRL